MSKSSVVVIGGGMAGAAVARDLSKKLDKSKHELILINPRPFDVWLPALVRCMVTGENDLDVIDKGAFTSYDRLFANGLGSLKVGTVTNIEAKDNGGIVHLESGETVPYTVLVLAVGCLWEGPLNVPISKADIDAHFATWRSRIKDAKHVVLAGAGAVGVEVAGEIKDLYPEKPVTIVQGGDAVLNSVYKPGFRETVAKGLTSRGVTFVYGDYVDTFPEDGALPDGVTTRHGKHIAADLYLSTRGGRPNTAVLASSGFTLNEHGQVPVELTFLAKGHKNVFAVGDITDIKEQKQCAKYGGHVSVVTANILSVLEKREPSKKYGGSPEILVLTNGKNGGAASFSFLGGMTMGAWFVRFVKAKDLMTAYHRKDMGFSG